MKEQPLPRAAYKRVVASVLGSGSYGVVVELEGEPSRVAKLLFAPHVTSLSPEWMSSNLPGAVLQPLPAQGEQGYESSIADLDIGLVAAEINARASAPGTFGGFFCMEAASLVPSAGRTSLVSSAERNAFPCFALYMRRETPVTFKSWAAMCPRQRMGCARDWARQLAHLHANGLVHRDVSVSNLATASRGSYNNDAAQCNNKLDNNGGTTSGVEGVLIDFGLTGPPSTTFNGDMVYAADFRPPEAKAGGKVSHLVCSGDWYALGVSLLQLEIGRRCFTGKDAHRSMHRLLPPANASLDALSNMLGTQFGVQPGEMRDCIAGLMARKPGNRHPPPPLLLPGAGGAACYPRAPQGGAAAAVYDFGACEFTADAQNMREIMTWMARASAEELHPTSPSAMWALPWERNKRLATALDQFMRVMPLWTSQGSALPGAIAAHFSAAENRGGDGRLTPEVTFTMEQAKLVAAACLFLADAVCMLGNGMYFSVETPALAAYARVKPFLLNFAAHHVMILLGGKLTAPALTLPDLFKGSERTNPIVVSGCAEALLSVCSEKNDMGKLAASVREQLGGERCNSLGATEEEDDKGRSYSIDEGGSGYDSNGRCAGKARGLKRSRGGELEKTREFSKFKLRRVVG